VRRKAGKAFVNGVEDHDVRIQLLVGGEKKVDEALRQALELKDTLGQPVPTNQAKRPPTIGMLKMWEAWPLSRELPLRKESRRQRPTTNIRVLRFCLICSSK
jgi:hypothetical protein